MSLAEKLATIREGAKQRVPEEVRAKMGRATQELRDSGVLDGVIERGRRLPPFALENQRGTTVRSEDLLGRGALVISVYRGGW